MGKHPDLSKLDDLFEQGTDFQLTGALYEERTGAVLPKNKSYIKNGSALARKALKYGFEISEVQEKAVIVKTVYFKKK